MNKNIDYVSVENIESYEKDFDANEKNLVAKNAVCNVGIAEASLNNDLIRSLNHNYSLEVEGGKVTNQLRSGRCWMFAGTNIMRFEVMKNLNIKNMELSQNFTLFYDKLEKSNFFLENIIKTVFEPLEGRLVNHLLKDPIGDGGQWDMFVSLIEKYGICPKDCMPETFTSSNTMLMDKYITTKLREFACILRSESENGKDEKALRELKNQMLETIYNILVISLGKPPKTFTYETRDKDNKFIRIENITPVEFYKQYVKLDLSNLVSIINAPTKDKPYNRSFTVDFLGNVIGGKEVKYLNLPIERLKELVIASLKDGHAVWFGSDVGQFSNRNAGILAMDAYNLENTLGTTFNMTKAQRLDYGESLMTHAMTIVGVNLVDDKPNRWKVENSWGETTGKDGFYVMSEEWFNQFVYQIVIDKKYLSDEEKAQYDLDPIHLKPWDPCGSLAN